GVEGLAVAMIEAPSMPSGIAGGAGGGMAMAEAVELELAQHARNGTGAPFVLVDDAEKLDAKSRAALRTAAEQGARLAIVAPRALGAELSIRDPEVFE